ncbi:hypothetical protein BJ508DRAFT_349977 [Ascobolus immersus RN42]|uniref:Uncharacterized protein n=1 Tax=Ascobolus immersus RN42 TaxID=1160509 RepID=A0A3N4HXS8_ASCIM|nr:hypothetical protein BJ508DRAFT_349977 [Ascobolus immersus RN42]
MLAIIRPISINFPGPTCPGTTQSHTCKPLQLPTPHKPSTSPTSPPLPTPPQSSARNPLHILSLAAPLTTTQSLIRTLHPPTWRPSQDATFTYIYGHASGQLPAFLYGILNFSVAEVDAVLEILDADLLSGRGNVIGKSISQILALRRKEHASGTLTTVVIPLDPGLDPMDWTFSPDASEGGPGEYEERLELVLHHILEREVCSRGGIRMDEISPNARHRDAVEAVLLLAERVSVAKGRCGEDEKVSVRLTSLGGPVKRRWREEMREVEACLEGFFTWAHCDVERGLRDKGDGVPWEWPMEGDVGGEEEMEEKMEEEVGDVVDLFDMRGGWEDGMDSDSDDDMEAEIEDWPEGW